MRRKDRDLFRLVDVSFKHIRRDDFVLNSAKTGCDRSGERQIWVSISTGNAAFNTERFASANNTEPSSTIVKRPRWTQTTEYEKGEGENANAPRRVGAHDADWKRL